MFKSLNDYSVLDGDNIKLKLITVESKEKLLRKKISQIHLGLIVIFVTNKIKVGTSAKAHITIIDQGHTDFQKFIIANTKLDMSRTKQMVACSPNYTITINEFLEKIKIVV